MQFVAMAVAAAAKRTNIKPTPVRVALPSATGHQLTRPLEHARRGADRSGAVVAIGDDEQPIRASEGCGSGGDVVRVVGAVAIAVEGRDARGINRVCEVGVHTLDDFRHFWRGGAASLISRGVELLEVIQRHLDNGLGTQT